MMNISSRLTQDIVNWQGCQGTYEGGPEENGIPFGEKVGENKST